MKHPVTSKEKHAAQRHDSNRYALALVLGLVCLIPPVTPLGVLILAVTIWHAIDEKGMRR